MTANSLNYKHENKCRL